MYIKNAHILLSNCGLVINTYGKCAHCRPIHFNYKRFLQVSFVFSKGMRVVQEQSFQKDIFKYLTAALVRTFFFIQNDVNSL
jgi:hypothetical protein